MADLIGIGSTSKPIPTSTLSESACLKTQGEVPVNHFSFGLFNDNLLASAQDDGVVSFFDP